MNKQLIIDIFCWGIGLWLIGYLLGIALFFVVPPQMLGWVIMPIGVLITLWVLFKKIQGNLQYYLTLSFSWSLIAIMLDYFFLVKLLKPTDGYYKLDVYLYYVLTFALPLIVFWYKRTFKNS